MKKQKKVWTGLLLIPIAWLIDFISYFLCIYIDIMVIPDPNALGHPVPVTLLLWYILVIPFTIIMHLLGIIITVIRDGKRNKSTYRPNYPAMPPNIPNTVAMNPQIQPSKLRYCENCGNPVTSEDRYCPNCGYKLN
jgi:hypothetical protein